MKHLLSLFPKPSHYAGMEPGAIRKDPSKVKLHIALAFPDTYEVGMSYLGQKILYEIANSREEWLAERVMAPEREACEILRAHAEPLSTIESDTPLKRLAAVGFSVTHELCYTDVLNMLDLAGIPLRAKDRGDSLLEMPVILAGGGAMLGAEPLSPFIDLAALGDGEEFLPEFLELLSACREKGCSKTEFLAKAAHIPGVYVPGFYDEKGNCLRDGIPMPRRRIVANLDDAPYPVAQVIPAGAVHNRLSLEISRGCARGCRFCHAGMMYRPVRERSPENVDALLKKCLANTGYEEVSFLSLSAGDCTALKTIYESAFNECRKDQVALALPSLRVGSVDNDIMAKIAALRRTGCTLAPEAGSQRLRNVINKGVTEEQLLEHVAKLLEHGWRQVKLYFMIGLPTETDDDLLEILHLAQKAREAGGPGAPKMQVTVSVSPFVPKPFTPFQWEAQIDLPEMKRRIDFLRDAFKNKKGLRLKWHEPGASYLEGILSRGDRALADMVEKAFRKGAIFCGWTENFTLEPWLQALAECGMNARDYTGSRPIGEKLPWSHIDAGIREDFLRREREKAYQEKLTPDCRFAACSQCGACGDAQDQEKSGKCVPAHKLVFRERDQQTHKPDFDEQGRLLLRNYDSKPPEIAQPLTQKAALIRCWHFKTNMAAFLSHLELQAMLTRAFRRAKIPVAFSRGFHPMPLLSFGRALPVGAESHAEWFSLWLYEHWPPAKLQNQLNKFLDSDLRIGKTEMVREKAELSVWEAYKLLLPEQSLLAAIERFGLFSDQPEAIIDRETKKGIKTEDIRPYLLKWQVSVSQNGESGIYFTTDWSNGYISPALLVSNILGPVSGSAPVKLIKLKQGFLNNKEYGL